MEGLLHEYTGFTVFLKILDFFCSIWIYGPANWDGLDLKGIKYRYSITYDMHGVKTCVAFGRLKTAKKNMVLDSTVTV